MLTQEELKNIKLGQELFVKTPYGGKIYPKIEKIGSKYFYTSDNRKWDKSSGKHISEYMSASIWPSEDAWEAYCGEVHFRDIFKRKLSSVNVGELSLEKIRSACELLNIKLD